MAKDTPQEAKPTKKAKKNLGSVQSTALPRLGENFPYGTAFTVFFFLLLAYRILYITISPLQLSPEEAYYWSYAQHPDLSYFDHPPMVAWVIFLFTNLLGNTEFAIRIGAVLLSMATTYMVYLIGTRLFDKKAGFFAAVIYNLGFVFNIYATGITPDTPLFFFWTLGMYYYLRAWQDGGRKWWILAGIAAGCALLSKYTGAFLLASIPIFLLGEKANKKNKWLHYLVSVIIALLVFSPVIIWNIQNHFASFAFQTTERASTAISLSPGKVLSNFAGGVGFQAVFMSLFLFFAMVSCLWKVARLREKTFGQRFLLALSLPMLLFMLGISFITWVKTNWPTPGYIPAIILLGSWFAGGLVVLKERKATLYFTVLTVAFALFMNLLPQVQPFYPQMLPALSKANTMSGWVGLAARVKDAQALMPNPQNTFIVGHGYQIASELAFYGYQGQPVYSSNVFGERGLAYDFWQRDLSGLKGKDAIVVTGKFEEFDPELLKKHFHHYEELLPWDVNIGGVNVRTFKIYRAFDYYGPRV